MPPKGKGGIPAYTPRLRGAAYKLQDLTVRGTQLWWSKEGIPPFPIGGTTFAQYSELIMWPCSLCVANATHGLRPYYKFYAVQAQVAEEDSLRGRGKCAVVPTAQGVQGRSPWCAFFPYSFV